MTFIATINLMAMVFSVSCKAEERQATDPSEMSRERMAGARQGFSRTGSFDETRPQKFIPPAPTQSEIPEEASQRVLQDDSLVPGDIVSISRGLFRFQGSPEKERKADDFVRIR